MEKKTTKKEKTIIQEFEGQVKDIRLQFVEQLRSLESRTDTECALLSEIQEYFKKRAEVEQEYARNLEKLAKQISAKHKAEKQKRESWVVFSLYSWWQQLINETKTEARNRSVIADVYSHHVTTKMSGQAEELQRISKRCREIGSAAHQEILRVLGELHTAMKTYQLCHAAECAAETKFRAAETQKTRFEESFPKKIGNRKHRFLERDFEKKQAKYLEFKLKALKARNEYLLCIDAANAALHKYFADDLSDLIDCMDVGMEQWLRSLVSTIVDLRRTVMDTESKQLDGTKSWLQDIDARSDKRRFLEANHSTFMLPRKFEFRPHGGDEVRYVTAQKAVQEELLQRYGQLQRRLRELKAENEEIWKTYATAERKLMEIQRTPELKIQELFSPPPSPPPHSSGSTFNALGNVYASATGTMSTIVSGTGNNNEPGTPRRNSCRETESAQQKRKMDLCEMEEYLLQKFHQYLLTCNLIQRLEARHDAIENSLGIRPSRTGSATTVSNGHDGHYGYTVTRDDSNHSLVSSLVTDGEMVNSSASVLQSRPPSAAPKFRKKRVGQTASIDNCRPRLFGGSLEEYVEATGEEIPLIIRSCVRYLSLFGLHHQGVFRVSGSQIEINSFKDAFEKGDDPLADVNDASDVNSVAGVLKLYFRELREPLFPIFMFDQFVDCTRGETKPDVVQRIKDLVKTLPRPVFIVMRYLFAFLNHLSEFSDENMMDPYNLAICFGPTLLPIPESRDQVFFHNHVNELVRNMIVFHDDIFPKNDPQGGIYYEKYLLTDSATGDMTNDEEDGGDDDVAGEYGGHTGLVCSQEDLMTASIIPAMWDMTPTSPAVAAPTAPARVYLETGNGTQESTLCRTHSDLNLSGHTSLKDADSPGENLSDTNGYLGEDKKQQAVWLRRTDSDRSKPNEKDTVILRDVVNSKEKTTIPEACFNQISSAGQDICKKDGDDPSRKSRVPPCRTNSDFGHSSNTASSAKVMDKPIPGIDSASGYTLVSGISNPVYRIPQAPSSAVGNANTYQLPSGAGTVSYTPGISGTSTAYMRQYSLANPSGSPKASRRDGVIPPLKRLSLSSYAMPITVVAEPRHVDTTPISALPTTHEEYCYHYPDSEITRPVQQPKQQAPKGLSPTSLKEIQVELKAVLNSLETFTIQQQTRLNGSAPRDAPFILSAPDALVVTSPVSPPDLVQNLPSPKGESTSPVTGSVQPRSTRSSIVSDGSSMSLSTTAERFAENKESTMKKGLLISSVPSHVDGVITKNQDPRIQPAQTTGGLASRQKPPVPKKPLTNQYRHAPSSPMHHRRLSVNDSSDEFSEDAML